jgi:oxygen-independent coproporphyrinogen III oxidase
MQQLLKRYDTAGPRYTSYPPAPHFREGFSAERYSALLRHMAEDIQATSAQTPVVSSTHRIPLSLYFHLPFCDTLCYFCGCTMLVSNDRQKIHTYVEYLKREITLVAKELDRSRYYVSQMHWGGGSPTHLLPEEIEELGAHIREHFEFDPNAEISIEVDPRGFTTEHARALQDLGFNRASVGVQDFFPDTQWAINRIQSYDLTANVISMLRHAGITSINIDMIYGLPYQTIGTFRNTIDQVLSLRPERIAVYNFAYVPWVKPHQKVIQIEMLPLADKKVALHYTAIEKISQAGYEYIGMDHFARPEDELTKAQRTGSLQRNFQGYSTKAGTRLIGMGMSAIGKIISPDGAATFVQNFKTLDKYYAAIDANSLPVDKGYAMTLDDRIREDVISQIMCQQSVNVKTTERRYKIDFQQYFAKALERLDPMQLDRLVDIHRVNGALQEIILPSLGKLFLRNIAMCFDVYYVPPPIFPSSLSHRPAEEATVVECKLPVEPGAPQLPLYSRTL